MIEILESPKHLVAMRLSGSMTGEDVSKAHAATEERLKDNERISFFAEIDDSMGFTLEGVAADLFAGVKRIGRLSKYYRAAVVTDKGWLGAMTRIEGLMFSSIDVRVFPPAERDKAFAWASEKPEPLPKPEVPEPSIHFPSTTSENVFAYELNGKLREKDVKALVEAMTPYLGREGKTNVLARIKSFGGFDLLSLFDDALIKMNFRSMSKIERYAIVGAPAWMRNLLELTAPLVSTQVKIFDATEEEAAWEWIGARQTLLAEA